MSALKPYPEYRGSGVDWLGEVPADWKVCPIKFVSTYNDDVLGESTPEDTEIVYVEISDVNEFAGVQLNDPIVYGEAPSRARRVAHKGDVLVSTVRTYLRAIAAVDKELPNLIASTGFAVLRASKIEPEFLRFAMLTEYVIDEIISRSVGVSYPAINASDLVRVKIPVPTSVEQRAISSFLDHETAEIDGFIADQKELVALLKERRAATITQAVTKGLDLTVPLKDSGVPWMGKVPEHWTKGRITRFAEMKTGHTPSRSTPEYWVECDIPWFTLADVWQLRKGARHLGETRQKISRLGLSNSAAELLPAGTVVLSRTASVGFSGIMPIPMATSQDYWNWVCGPKLMPEYLWYQFSAMTPHFASVTQGSTHKTIYQADAASLQVAVPPMEEQEKVVAHLDHEISEIDAAIADAEEAIALSKERRTALISAAVTGKIDVRNHITAELGAA